MFDVEIPSHHHQHSQRKNDGLYGTSFFLKKDVHKQKDHRNRKEKRKLHLVEAQAETEHGMIMPMARARDDGAPVDAPVCIGGEWVVLDRRRALNSTLYPAIFGEW